MGEIASAPVLSKIRTKYSRLPNTTDFSFQLTIVSQQDVYTVQFNFILNGKISLHTRSCPTYSTRRCPAPTSYCHIPLFHVSVTQSGAPALQSPWLLWHSSTPLSVTHLELRGSLDWMPSACYDGQGGQNVIATTALHIRRGRPGDLPLLARTIYLGFHQQVLVWSENWSPRN
jgi:hypothetical protein